MLEKLSLIHISVGTTSCRTLEAVATKYGEIRACSGDTDIFIYPGYQFKAIDGLITNFHLPESTLIMLVSDVYKRQAEDGAAACEDTGEILLLHQAVFAVNQAAVTVDDSVNFQPVVPEMAVERLCNAADGGVQALAVAAARQNSYPVHVSHFPVHLFFIPCMDVSRQNRRADRFALFYLLILSQLFLRKL